MTNSKQRLKKLEATKKANPIYKPSAYIKQLRTRLGIDMETTAEPIRDSDEYIRLLQKSIHRDFSDAK